jgi:Actinobacteria/chloroflexi VLRF1 release factor
MTRTVLVPRERVVRWFSNFATRHGAPEFDVVTGQLLATAPDGAVASAALPFGCSYSGSADAGSFADAITAPPMWGVLLVRKGGFAVASVSADRITESKVGQRHVQGRTKAGGQSQQRFARRRENQAREAYHAAADHAARILPGVAALVCGGDRQAVDLVLSDSRLRSVAAVRVEPWLAVADPRRAVLEQAIADGGSAAISVSADASGEM